MVRSCPVWLAVWWATACLPLAAWSQEGQKFAVLIGAAPRWDSMELGPDSEFHEGIPKGKIEEFEWNSDIFPMSMRKVSVYVPPDSLRWLWRAEEELVGDPR